MYTNLPLKNYNAKIYEITMQAFQDSVDSKLLKSFSLFKDVSNYILKKKKRDMFIIVKLSGNKLII